MLVTFMEVLEWAEDTGIQDLESIHDNLTNLLGAATAYKFGCQLRNVYAETEVEPSWSTSDLIKYFNEHKSVYIRYSYFN